MMLFGELLLSVVMIRDGGGFALDSWHITRPVLTVAGRRLWHTTLCAAGMVAAMTNPTFYHSASRAIHGCTQGRGVKIARLNRSKTARVIRFFCVRVEGCQAQRRKIRN